jgi:hypothetical protein
MKIAKNKAAATVIALFLVLSIAATLMTVLPTANAAVTYHTSYVYVSVGNSVIGVGQSELLVMWPADLPPDIGEIAGTAPGGRAAYYNVGINVTKPDGTTEEFIIAKTDPVGGGYVYYTPDTVGTYSVISWFPETWKNTTTNQIYYSAAVSYAVNFTVQQDPIQPWPEAPLPTGYWSRPINDASRNWYVLGGNWLGGAHEQPPGAAGGTPSRWVDGLGPESAHILWSKPYYLGGIMEERFGDTGSMTGHYNGLSWTAIVLNGKMWYTPRASNAQTQGVLCVDLYTGETLYFLNETMPSFGQIYNYESPNEHGSYTYLWRTSGVTLPEMVRLAQAKYDGAGNLPLRLDANIEVNRTQTPISTGTVWEMLDGYTFKTICYVANVTSGGTAVYGKDGSILRYNLVNYGTTAAPNYYLTVWNSSAGTMVASHESTGAWQWRPAGGSGSGASLSYFGSVASNNVHNGNLMWSLNVSIPSPLGPRNALLNETGTIRAVREDEYVVIGTAGRNDERGIVPGYMMAVSLKRGEEGRKMWDMTFTPPFASQLGNVTVSMTGVYPEDGVICFESSKLLKRWGFSLETGQQLWESAPEAQMNYYTMIDNYYDGMLLTAGFSGKLLAYNITTGEILWTFTAANVGFESPYGDYPINMFAIADGKIYTLTGEHSISQPMWRGPNIRCINASNGVELWNLLGFGANGGASLGGQYMQMADGRVLGLNFFDNKIYCIGKGDSATTVSAPQTVPALGSSVMITGTVTDQTPTGSRNTNDMQDFTLKGTPAISDADMGRWMEYLFMDQGRPTDAKGVEVSLDTIDPNGNYVHIGTVTSDITGAYGYAFTPDVPGTYQIIATFAGSASYGASYAQTYLSVGEAPPPTASPPEYPQPIDNTMTIVVTGIAIIIAVAIVGILLLRKK